MSAHPALTAIEHLEAQVSILRRAIPAWTAHVNAELTLLDGYPGGNDNPKVSGSGGHSSVEVAAQRRITAQRQVDVEDRLNTTVGVLRALIRDIMRDITDRQHVEVKRCSATGRDGALEWSDPLCWDVPSRGPLCDRCAKREYRWRAAHQLPARTDGLFSGDAA